MNPLWNPIFFYRLFKKYLAEPDQLKRMKQEDIIKFQNQALRRIIKYAYQVPLYKEKYIKNGIRPNDIKQISDINKLPLITKEELRKNFPHNITPPYFNKKNAFVATTSGTTGRSLPMFFDIYTILTTMLGFIRALNEHQINWKKTKMTLLLDLSENSFENEYFIRSLFSFIKPLISLRNIQILDVQESPKNVVKKMEIFQPEAIIGYPFIIIQLAHLKTRGYANKINPKVIGSSGSYFDRYSRKLVEEIFDTRIFEIYAATESGIIAFGCKKGELHVCSDLVYLEYMKNREPVPNGEPGSVVITKLYGGGTPIIRYTGLKDIVTPSYTKCDCGLPGETLGGIHGRKTDSIILPEGKIALVSFFENIIGEILYERKNINIKRIQIIQHQINGIEIKLHFGKTKNKEYSTEKIISAIKKRLIDKLDINIDILITEVESFESKDPYFVSKIDISKFIEKEYLV